MLPGLKSHVGSDDGLGGHEPEGDIHGTLNGEQYRNRDAPVLGDDFTAGEIRNGASDYGQNIEKDSLRLER